MDIDYYKVEFESEDYCVSKLNAMNKLCNNYFQLLINDDEDYIYIPKLDFEYEICDCKNIDLLHRKAWDKFIESKNTIIFINTNYLFEQFKDKNILGSVCKDGRSAFTQMFYLFYRDKMWEEGKGKYIFLVTEEDAYTMYSSVNNGFSILLNPIYMRKNINKKENEKTFMKTYKKIIKSV